MKIDQNNKYKEFKERFKNMSNAQFIAAFNHEVGNTGWVSARANYLAALHDEFIARGFDYSAIGNEQFISIKKKIKLVGKKITR